MNKHLKNQLDICNDDACNITEDIQFVASSGFQNNYFGSRAYKRVIDSIINLTDELSWLVTQLQKL